MNLLETMIAQLVLQFWYDVTAFKTFSKDESVIFYLINKFCHKEIVNGSLCLIHGYISIMISQYYNSEDVENMKDYFC